jgi:hypothetical protein
MQPIKQDRQPSGNIDCLTQLFNTAYAIMHGHQNRQMTHFECVVELQVCTSSISEHLSTEKGLQNHCTPNSNTINSSNITLTMNSYKAKEH